MSQRNIAEIIGWKRCDLADCVDVGEHWINAKGEQCEWFEEPAVDDMLAFLVGHCDQVFVNYHGPSDLSDVGLDEAQRVCVRLLPVVHIRREFRGPTLHAALEGAVRAVASPSPAEEPSRGDR